MEVLDVTGALARLAALPLEEAAVVGLAEDAAGRWELLALAPGQTWEAAPGGAWAALVLEGAATWRVGDTRQTLASGHLVRVPAGEAARVDNDGVARVSALIWAPPEAVSERLGA